MFDWVLNMPLSGILTMFYRSVFGTLLNIYYEGFKEKSWRLKLANYFWRKVPS